MNKGVSGTGLTAAATGVLFLWSAVKGASVTETLRQILGGEAPTGENRYPISAPAPSSGGTDGSGGQYVPGDAGKILQIAASMKGQPYAFGAGHTSNPCAVNKSDCSSYVSCVLNKAGIMKGSKTTGGFASFGVGVVYANRKPGDLIIWNGGTGGGHMGIIATVDGNGGTMWHNPCTGCGGVKIGRYPYGTRSAASAVVRRVTRA